MSRKHKEPVKTATTLCLEDEFETPLVELALKHEITRAKQFAKACKDTKKRLFHESIGRTYQGILDVMQSPSWWRL